MFENKKIIFWDFDGVIKESVEIKTLAFVKIFKSYNIDVKYIKEYHENNGGINRYDKFKHYLKKSNTRINKKLLDNLSNKFNKIVESKIVKSKFVPGIKKVFKNKKDKIFILTTATPQYEIENILKKISFYDYFDEIYGYPNMKYIIVKKTIKKFKINRKNFLYVGDAETDYKAASKNKIPFLLRINKSNANFQKKYKGPIINNFKH